MSLLRRKVSERLVAVKNQTAMLTTFNEVNMTPIFDLRKKYKETFKTKHDVSLGFMSFFTKAVVNSLKDFPDVHSMIDGDQQIKFDWGAFVVDMTMSLFPLIVIYGLLPMLS